MKKFAIKSLFFALFFALVFILTNLLYLGLLVNTDEGFMKRLQSLKFDNPDFELLVLGTSFAEYGIDTELLTSQGIKSFDLALGGNSLQTSYIQLDEYLTKYTQKPQYVLLVFNSYREALEKEDTAEIEPLVETTMKDYKYGLKDAPILRYTWLGTEMVKKILSSKHRKARLSYGQVKFEKRTSDNTNYDEIYLNIQEIESSHWIGEIAKLCNQADIDLMLIEIPGFRETQNLSDFGPYKLHFNNESSALLYNFNSQEFCKIFDSDKDWIGNSHLNEFGAHKFAQELFKVLNNTDSVQK
jgi:hypothetical protein